MMRTARFLGGLAIVLLPAAVLRAEPIPETIKVPDVLVRSGPSPEFYPTSKLRQGAKVLVLPERGTTTGWLAIVPPSDSFSWIDPRLVHQTGPQAAVVSANEAQIWTGSRLSHSEPTVSRTTAARGTQLTIIGKSERGQSGMRLPISPVPAEVRYIPAEAVRPIAAAPQFVAAAAPSAERGAQSAAGDNHGPLRVSSPAPPGPEAVSPPTTPAGFAPPAVPAANINQLWLEADDAERAGNLARAQQLLQELAAKVQQSDSQLWARCINRIEDLRERGRPVPAAPAPTMGLAAANNLGGRNADRLAPTPYPYRPPQRGSSEYCYVQDPGYTARLSSPVLTPPSPPPPPSLPWSDLGRLHRTAMPYVNGRYFYCLQPFDPTKRLMYAVPGPNVNLEPYIEKNVYLSGPVVYRGDLRNNLMTVVQIRGQ